MEDGFGVAGMNCFLHEPEEKPTGRQISSDRTACYSGGYWNAGKIDEKRLRQCNREGFQRCFSAGDIGKRFAQVCADKWKWYHEITSRLLYGRRGFFVVWEWSAVQVRGNSTKSQVFEFFIIRGKRFCKYYVISMRAWRTLKLRVMNNWGA